MIAVERSASLHKRLEESDLSRTVTVMTGLWRRGSHRAPDGMERREHIRIPTDDPATVQFAGRTSEVRVMDVSRGGMRLRSQELIATGTSIHIILGRTEVIGTVRYCIAAEGAYWVGVQVDSAV